MSEYNQAMNDDSQNNGEHQMMDQQNYSQEGAEGNVGDNSQDEGNYNGNGSQDDGTGNGDNGVSANMEESGGHGITGNGGQALEPEQFRKVFIGGLSYKTDDDALKAYFSKFGELVDHVVMKDGQTGRSRGFGFVTYSSSSMVDELMKNRPHIIDGRQVEPKRATPREDSGKPEVQMTVKKIFIGGMRDNITDEELKTYFSNYGNITDCLVMRDKETQKSRGFGFVTFDDYDPVDKIILEKHHTINGVALHIQKALPKDADSNQRGGNQMNRGGPRGNFGNNNFGNMPNFNGGFGGGFANFGNPNFQRNGAGGGGNFGMQGPNRGFNQNGGAGGGGMRGNNQRMGGGNMGGGGGGGPMKGGQGRFMNRSSGPYGGGGSAMGAGGNMGGFNNGNNFNNNRAGRGGGRGVGRGGASQNQ